MAQGKNGKKVGKNRNQCLAYKSRQQRERNKARKLSKYLRGAHRNDKVALEALTKLAAKFGFAKPYLAATGLS